MWRGGFEVEGDLHQLQYIYHDNLIFAHELVEGRHTHAQLINFHYVMKLAHKKIEKIDQRLRIQPLRGGKPPLHYINEQFLDDTNDKTSFLCIGV